MHAYQALQVVHAVWSLLDNFLQELGNDRSSGTLVALNIPHHSSSIIHYYVVGGGFSGEWNHY